MKTTSITFIGGGNMARSLISGLIKKGYAASNICVIEPDIKTAASLNVDFSIKTFNAAKNQHLDVDFVFLAVKPQILKSICINLSPLLSNPKTIFLSIAAGINTQSMQTWLSREDKTPTIIRSMPNTPALISLSATGLYSSRVLSEQQKQVIENIFNAFGICVWVDEEDQLDTITALSGSGPAYFFSLCENLISAGIAEGLNAEQAHQLVVQTAVGAAHMALMTSAQASTDRKQKRSIGQLREKVTSKGGTTEAGLQVFENAHYKQLVHQALKAAKHRSKTLSLEYGKE